jgi:uncharacterized protein YbjT (DUF2867 family)
MAVAPTGATGLIGSAVLRELLATGHEVTALVRSESAPFADAPLLDQVASNAKAKSLGWKPDGPSLLEVLRA